jgi:hypothetical protein
MNTNHPKTLNPIRRQALAQLAAHDALPELALHASGAELAALASLGMVRRVDGVAEITTYGRVCASGEACSCLTCSPAPVMSGAPVRTLAYYARKGFSVRL